MLAILSCTIRELNIYRVCIMLGLPLLWHEVWCIFDTIQASRLWMFMDVNMFHRREQHNAFEVVHVPCAVDTRYEYDLTSTI